jgi:hypothetical protein
VIPDDVIDTYLTVLFGRSDPGQAIHHMLLATADTADTPFGFPDPQKLKVSMFALAPTDEIDPEQFITECIAGGIIEQHLEHATIYFAGVALEVHSVEPDGTELTENLARRMGADKLLHEHPAACEITWLYAACRDGRRWTGRHYLTGPKQGTIIGPDTRFGLALSDHEIGPRQFMIRRAVGLQ